MSDRQTAWLLIEGRYKSSGAAEETIVGVALTNTAATAWVQAYFEQGKFRSSIPKPVIAGPTSDALLKQIENKEPER